MPSLKKKSAAAAPAAPAPAAAPAATNGSKRPRVNLDNFEYAVWIGGRIPHGFVNTIDEVKAIIAANPGKKINVFKRQPLKIDVQISL